MDKVRIGMDILINLSVMRLNAPEDLTNAGNISIKLCHTKLAGRELISTFEVVDANIIKILVKGCDQELTGQYRLTLSYTKHRQDRNPHDEPFVLDVMAFEIVKYSDMVQEGGECSNLQVKQMQFALTIDKAKDGAPGETPQIGANNNWWIHGVDTGVDARGIKGDTGPSAYQFAVDGGYAGTIEEFAQELVDLTNNSSRLLEVEQNKANLVGGLVPMSEIDPMQGRYTSITTPKGDNSVKFTGNVADIGEGDFMIEFVCNMENSTADGNSTFYLGGGTIDLLILGASPLNQLERIFIGDQTMQYSKSKPLGKQFHNVIDRSGMDARLYVDGVRLADIPQSTIHNILNSVTISNASNFSLLRKFNFADEDFAKSLYNGGRWWESVIGEKYRGDTSLNDTYSHNLGQDSTPVSLYFGGAGIKAGFPILYNGVYCQRYHMPTPSLRFETPTPNIAGSFQTKKIKIYIPASTFNGNAQKIALEQFGGLLMDCPADTWVDIEHTSVTSSGAWGSVYFSTFGNTSLEGDIYIAILENPILALQNEFDYKGICDNGVWQDTVNKGNKLIATNNDKIIYNTAPLFKPVIWGANAPIFAPDFIGQEYYDMTNKVKYSAFGTATSQDWISQ